LTRSDQNQDKF